MGIDQVDERRERGAAELEFALVDFVKAVLGGVVDVKVALGIWHEIADRCALEKQRGDIGAATALFEEVDAVGFEEWKPAPSTVVSIALGASQKEVAAELGVSENVVEAQGAIGFRKIRKFFARHDRPDLSV